MSNEEKVVVNDLNDEKNKKTNKIKKNEFLIYFQKKQKPQW